MTEKEKMVRVLKLREKSRDELNKMLEAAQEVIEGKAAEMRYSEYQSEVCPDNVYTTVMDGLRQLENDLATTIANIEEVVDKYNELAFK